MKALITGASSGIGRDIARVLSERGYDLILVSRTKENLEKLKKELKTNIDIYTYDLSSTFNCNKLYEKVKTEDIDILVNNAGFGLAGNFNTTSLDKELDMIDLNIKAVHVLTKLFLQKFMKKNDGYILNVASMASFSPGPLMATYYSTKSYVYNLTLAISEELKHKKSNVRISVLCPGPTKTGFNKVAKVEFKYKSLNSRDVAEYAINQMFKNKLIIIPGFKYKFLRIANNILPITTKLKYIYNIQKEKK